MFERLEDARLRVAAFDWLSAQVDVYGDSLSRSILAEGFEFQGQRVPLLGPQGIFKPATLLPATLTRLRGYSVT